MPEQLVVVCLDLGVMENAGIKNFGSRFSERRSVSLEDYGSVWVVDACLTVDVVGVIYGVLAHVYGRVS